MIRIPPLDIVRQGILVQLISLNEENDRLSCGALIDRHYSSNRDEDEISDGLKQP